jgi:phage head maturation protease
VPTLEIAERRVMEVPLQKVEFRDGDEGGMTLTGHAAVFDQLSDELGFFREKIARGAFRKVLDSQPDVRLLINHDDNLVLARTKNGTLKLSRIRPGSWSRPTSRT